MNIIGISAFYHDSACALISNGKLVSAVSEERFSRFKNDNRLPVRAFRYCLEKSNLNITDIDCIAYYEEPPLKLSRQLQFNAFTVSNTDWIDCNKPIREIREQLGYEGEIKIYNHHISHAAGSFFYSGFEDAAILTTDGVGEWATTTFGKASGAEIEILEETRFPHSVGLLYSAITNYLGFKVLSGEYKIMGLAPYGEPTYGSKLRKLFNIDTGNDFSLNMEYFDFSSAERMYTEALPELLELPPRVPESAVEQSHKDLAKSIQVVLEEILLKQVAYLKTQVDSDNLCMSGGVALNCVATRAIRRSGIFKNIFVQPAAGDSGSSLGAAALAYAEKTNTRHCHERMPNIYLGPSYSCDEIKQLLDSLEFEYHDHTGDEPALLSQVVNRIAEGKVIAWFHGAMEFGPRALGGRSLLADPRDPAMRDTLNAFVKKREAFRPFAPAILEEKVKEHLLLDIDSPFMLETCEVKSSLDLPAITHVDGSCRPQTVNAKSNPRFYALIKCFHEKTGCPILINTSFNVRGEPIVCSPLDAIRCFGNSDIDVLVLENFIIDAEMLSSQFKYFAQMEANAIKPPTDIFTGKATDSIYTFI